MTVPDPEPSVREMKVAWRRAVTETRSILERASQAWAQHGCPGSAQCCQLNVTKKEPWLWPSEWKLLLATLAAQRRALPPPRADGACPLLDPEGLRCTVYATRPFGCRTYFCHRITGPSKVPAPATNALLDRLASLNIATDAAAQPRSILAWAAALEEET
jgi:uncharacterized protein